MAYLFERLIINIDERIRTSRGTGKARGKYCSRECLFVSMQSFTEEQLSKVRLLTSQNVPRERAIALLQATNWDPDMALVQYMSSLP